MAGHVPQGELPRHYHDASVFATASIEEGQAMVQAQALACGLPLVCTGNTGGEDLLMVGGEGRETAPGIREYPAGMVVPPRSPESMAGALRRLAGEPRLLMAMAAAAAKLAQADLSWRRYADANLRQYEAMVAGNGSAAVR
jgi:glycosyltransferase involved in cell wall biosynthesis